MKMKRAVALFLTFIMLLQVMPVSVIAEQGATDRKGFKQVESNDILGATVEEAFEIVFEAVEQESPETAQGEIQGTPEDVREQVTVDAAQTQVVAEVSPVAEQIAIENIQEQEIAKLAQAQEQAVAEELGLIQDTVTGEDKAI